jgi:hypothetical protein
MTLYMKRGTSYRVTTQEAINLEETLPVGTYSAEIDPMSGEFYLDRIRDLEVGHKIYGDAPHLTDRILNTFLSRPDSTGVLLTGEKGSGKTLQAKLLSVTARKRLDIPTITVSRPFRGDGFNQFMQMIEQPVVVIFDEFEKVYSREEQEAMLTLLDGIYPSKKLFVLTCNDKYRINEQMKNRPGRLFYRVEYSGIEDDFIREYSKDNLLDATDERIDGILTVASVFHAFNFDMLQALIEEMNRYGEDAKVANKFLNARPDDDDLELNYDVELVVNGVEVPEDHNHNKTWRGNPIMSDLWMTIRYVVDEAPAPSSPSASSEALAHAAGSIEWPVADPKGGIRKVPTKQAVFTDVDLKDVYVEKGRGPVFEFHNEQGEVVRLRRRRERPVYTQVF